MDEKNIVMVVSQMIMIVRIILLEIIVIMKNDYSNNNINKKN